MDLRMAVLVMRVVPAQYAFVIHTVNPATRDEDEIYCELVKVLLSTHRTDRQTRITLIFFTLCHYFASAGVDPRNGNCL
jgi:hypothetical protein